MAIAEHQTTVVGLPTWYLWLARRVVTDPYSGVDIDLFGLVCVSERLTPMPSGDRLCCEFVTDNPAVPVTSVYDAVKRVWIHIRFGGNCQTGGAMSDVHDFS